MYTLWHKPQKSALDNSSSAGPIGHICCLHIGRRGRKGQTGQAMIEYDNGRLSGVLNEVLPLLLDDHGGRQDVANAKMLSCTLEVVLCARH